VNEKTVKVDIELSEESVAMAKYLMVRREYDSLSKFLVDIFSESVECSELAERRRMQMERDSTGRGSDDKVLLSPL
jgi:hypothetical protein